MRHKVYGKHLGRNKNQRTALFKSLVQSLILNGSIQTTDAKAKAIKPTVDKIINQAKNKNTQRLLQQFLAAKPIREKLVKDIAPALKDRTSGYTSVVKIGPRLGDGAMMVRMSLLVEVPRGEKVPQVPREEEKTRDTRDTRQSNGTSTSKPATKRATRKATK